MGDHQTVSKNGRSHSFLWDQWYVDPTHEKKCFCRWCEGAKQYQNAVKCQRHTLTCREVPAEVRLEIAKKVKSIGKAKKRLLNESGEDSGEDDDEDEQDRAVKILTGLLTRGKGDDTTNKKPLKSFTDADFDRELKELAVKKARLELRELEERNKLYLKVGKGFDKLIKACDLYVEEKTAGRSMTIYPDGTSILQAAYEDSVAEDNQVK